MKQGLRKTLKISALAAGAVVLLLAAVVLVAVFDKPLVRGLVEKRLGAGPGSAARLGRLDYSLFPFRITAEAVEIVREDRFQKLTVGLARLEAAGAFWKLVRGVKPALDSIEAQGLTLRLEQRAVTEAPLDLPKALLQVSDALAWAKRVSLSGAGLSLGFLAGRTEIEGLDLVLTPGPERDAAAYAIPRARVLMTDPAGVPTLSAGLASSGKLRFASPYLVEGAFTVDTLRLQAAGIEQGLDGLTLSLTARLDRPNQELTVSDLKVVVPGLMDLRGRLVGKSAYGIFLEAEGEARFDDLAAAARLFGPRLPAALRSADPRGRARLSGRYVLQDSDLERKDNLAAGLELEAVELTADVDGRPVRVRASGRLDATGPSRHPRIDADLRATLGRIALPGLTVAGSDVQLVAAGTPAAAEISRLDGRLAGVSFEAAPGRPPLTFAAAGLTARASVDVAGRSLRLTSLEARLPGLAPIRFSGCFGASARAAAELRLESRGLDLPALRALAAPYLPPALAGWDVGGTLDLSLDVRRPAASRGDWAFSGTLTLAGVKFNDPSFTVAGENLDPVVRFEGRGSPDNGLSFSAGLDLGRGESLWRSVYVAWDKHPLRLTAAGRYLPAAASVEGLTARAALPGIGTIDLSGAVRLAPAPSFDLKAAAAMDLGPLYSLYTQAGVAEEARMKLEGGLAAALDVRLAGEALSVGGRVTLAGARIDRPAGKTTLVGLDADIPVLYDSRPAPDAPLAESGRLRVAELRNPYLSLENVEIALRAGVNALGLEPLGLDVYGGRLELGRMVFRLDPAAGGFRGLGSLVLRGLDISRFPIASPQLKLTGAVEADFPRLDISPDRIAISGRGEARIFGGTVVLRDLAVADPFATGRSMSLNADLVDLDLKKLTDEVPFGEVTGIVRGEIRNLVLSYGQPERFEFRLESVPRKGVARTFSLKAVDNLTVLSSGQQASAGTGGFWMKLIRGFRYEKLGIVSTLRNDTFTLNGTIHEGGVEYLVKKPPLFGINVVNREPDKKISFKDMTGRLKRIGQSGN